MIISIATGLVALIVMLSGGNPFPVLFAGALALFFIYVLWKLPKKHKDYSLSDQQEAMSRALGGSPPPDISRLKPDEQRKSRRRST